MKEKLNQNSLALAATIVAATVMLLLGILGNLGIYTGAVEMMIQWHMFFSLSIGGIITGIIEASIITYIFVYYFAWLYNKLN